jgi:hypothetical protein
MGSPWPGSVRFSEGPRERSRGFHRTPPTSAPAWSRSPPPKRAPCWRPPGDIPCRAARPRRGLSGRHRRYKAVLTNGTGEQHGIQARPNSSARPPGRRSVAWSDELRDDRRRRRPDWGPHVNKRRMGKAKMKRPLSIKRRKQFRRRPPQYVAATASGSTVEPPPFIAGADRSSTPLPLVPPESTPAPESVQVASEPSAASVFSVESGLTADAFIPGRGVKAGRRTSVSKLGISRSVRVSPPWYCFQYNR